MNWKGFLTAVTLAGVAMAAAGCTQGPGSDGTGLPSAGETAGDSQEQGAETGTDAAPAVGEEDATPTGGDGTTADGGVTPAEPPAQGEEEPVEEEPAAPAIELTVPAEGAEIAGQTIHLEGRARVYEGAFMAEVEDGHYVLGRTPVQAEAGAPAWGDFSADLKMDQLPTSRSLTLILYVESAKDGSRQELLVRPLRYTGPCGENRC